MLKKPTSPEMLVRSCSKLLSEIESWFHNHQETKNIFNTTVPHEIMKNAQQKT